MFLGIPVGYTAVESGRYTTDGDIFDFKYVKPFEKANLDTWVSPQGMISCIVG